MSHPVASYQLSHCHLFFIGGLGLFTGWLKALCSGLCSLSATTGKLVAVGGWEGGERSWAGGSVKSIYIKNISYRYGHANRYKFRYEYMFSYYIYIHVHLYIHVRVYIKIIHTHTYAHTHLHRNREWRSSHQILQRVRENEKEKESERAGKQASKRDKARKRACARESERVKE